MDILINEMGLESYPTREAGMIKRMTRSTERKRNATSVVKNDTHNLISQRLKKIKTTMTREQGVPVVER